MNKFILWSMLACGALGNSAPMWAQEQFKTPQLAVRALEQASLSTSDEALNTLFGPLAEKLLSPDKDSRQETRRILNLLFKERWELAPLPDGRKLLRMGQEGWPFPVTLVQKAGAWQFDSEAGIEEVLNRRIGRNELVAVETCLCIAKAQDDYRSEDRDGDGVREYAGQLISSPNQRDGLYWETSDKESPSPLQGALKHSWRYAEDRTKGTPWFGYHFQLLQGQAAAAPGGARNYSLNGNQVTGWALVAYPAVYQSTGVMSFLCSQDGVVYEKDLGPETEQTAKAMTVFDPGDGWDRVPRQDLPH